MGALETKGDIQGRKMTPEDKQYYDKIQYAGLLTGSIKNIQIAINTGTDSAGEEVSGLYTLLLPDIKARLDPHISFFRDRLNEYIRSKNNFALRICTTGQNKCGTNCITCVRAVPEPHTFFEGTYKEYLKQCAKDKKKPLPKPIPLINKIHRNNTTIDPYEYKCELIYYFALMELDWIIKELHGRNLLLFSSNTGLIGGDYTIAEDMK